MYLENTSARKYSDNNFLMQAAKTKVFFIFSNFLFYPLLGGVENAPTTTF
jgi:hypothetical protein